MLIAAIVDNLMEFIMEKQIAVEHLKIINERETTEFVTHCIAPVYLILKLYNLQLHFRLHFVLFQ